MRVMLKHRYITFDLQLFDFDFEFFNLNYINCLNALSLFFSLKLNAKTSNILKNKECFKHCYEIVVVDNNKNENCKNVTMNLNDFCKKFFNFEKNTILRNNNIFLTMKIRFVAIMIDIIE